MDRTTLLLLAAVGVASSGPSLAATTFYTDLGTFQANATTPVLLDLNSLTAPNTFVFYGSPGFVDLGPLTVGTNGPLYAQNNNLWGTGGFLSPQQLQGATVTFALDSPVTAFAINYGAGAPMSASVGSDFFILAPTSSPPFVMNFFGVTSDTPFSLVTLTMSGSGADIDNIRFGTQTLAAVPEPSTWAMMLLGFGAIGFAMRRGKIVRSSQFA
jgi:hypothetical protein